MRLLLGAMIAALLAPQASAETLTVCGESQGSAYYFAGGIVARDKAGWQKDGITGGQMMLIRNDAEFDLVYTDATRGTKSAKADGATIIFLGGQGPFAIMEIYVIEGGATVSTYSFQLDAAGNGHVVWTQNKINPVINKVAVYTAQCRAPK